MISKYQIKSEKHEYVQKKKKIICLHTFYSFVEEIVNLMLANAVEYSLQKYVTLTFLVHHLIV